VVGGASFINILLGIVRTKVLALLLGPSGIGVLGIYNSVVQTATSFAGLGIARSGVRQIAESYAAGTGSSSAKAASAMLRWSLGLGILGGVAVAILRRPISELAFHHSHQATEIAWLGIAVAAGILSMGQIAILQGTRHVRFLAQQNVLGALLGTVISVPIVYRYGRAGIPWVVVTVALIGLVSSWLYMAKVQLPKPRMLWQEYWTEGRSLISLGVMLMLTGLLSTGTLLLVRTFVNRHIGEAAAGYFQSAFSVSVIYLDFVLQSMAADFYPRLTAAAGNHENCNRLVNEQMEVALLMAAPLILGMLAFSQVVVELLYSKSFEPACELLRWQMLGSLVKVAAWPVGFIFLARNQGVKFFVCELVWNCTYVGFIFFGLNRFGLMVTGAGFCAAYVLYLVWTLMLAARATSFRLNGENRVLLLTFAAACLAIFLMERFGTPLVYYGVSSLIVVLCGGWSLRKLFRVIGAEKLRSLGRRCIGQQP
jgi:PST family polysaccharide transporter